VPQRASRPAPMCSMAARVTSTSWACRSPSDHDRHTWADHALRAAGASVSSEREASADACARRHGFPSACACDSPGRGGDHVDFAGSSVPFEGTSPRHRHSGSDGHGTACTGRSALIRERKRERKFDRGQVAAQRGAVDRGGSRWIAAGRCVGALSRRFAFRRGTPCAAVGGGRGTGAEVRNEAVVDDAGVP
jgi:hypothetical protein